MAGADEQRRLHPAAPLAPRTRARRPSTLVAYRWELRKLVSQKRTYLGLGLAVVLPLIFVVVQNVHQHHDHGGDTDLRRADHANRAWPRPC